MTETSSIDAQLHVKTEDVPCPGCGVMRQEEMASGWDFEYCTSTDEFKIRVCRQCDLAYLSPRPVIDELSRIYPPEYNPFNFQKMKNPFIRFGREAVQLRKVRTLEKYLTEGDRVMDIGCGSGNLLMLLQKKGRNSYDLWANDMDKAIVAHLEPMGISLAVGRLEDLELPAGHFDALIMNQVIEHLDAVKGVAAKAYELLKPGKVLIIETPCLKGADFRLFGRRYWGGWHFPRHWTVFTENSLARLFTTCGFAVNAVQFLPSPSFWIQSFHHWLLERAPRTKAYRLFTIKNPLALVAFTGVDLFTAKLGYTSNMRMILRKPA